MTPQGLEPTIHRSQGNHDYHYTTDTVCWLCTVSTLTWIPLVDLATKQFTHVLLTQDRKCVNRLLYEFSFNEDSVEFWVTIQANYCLSQQVAKIGSDVCANHIFVVYNTWTTCTPNFVLKVNQTVAPPPPNAVVFIIVLHEIWCPLYDKTLKV